MTQPFARETGLDTICRDQISACAELMSCFWVVRCRARLERDVGDLFWERLADLLQKFEWIKLDFRISVDNCLEPFPDFF